MCIFVEDDPIAHTMVSVEREKSGFDDCKKKGVLELVFHFKHVFNWIMVQDGVALSISLFLNFLPFCLFIMWIFCIHPVYWGSSIFIVDVILPIKNPIFCLLMIP